MKKWSQDTKWASGVFDHQLQNEDYQRPRPGRFNSRLLMSTAKNLTLISVMVMYYV